MNDIINTLRAKAANATSLDAYIEAMCELEQALMVQARKERAERKPYVLEYTGASYVDVDTSGT